MSDEMTKIAEDLGVTPGMGLTRQSGSDRYAYWVAEVRPGGVVGVYEAECRFDRDYPWEGGYQAVVDFKLAHKSDFYLKRSWRSWWRCTADGKRIRKWTTALVVSFSAGKPEAYRNPSF